MAVSLTGHHLGQSRRLRISAFTLFYFAQGIPIGLLTISLPGWLAELEVSAQDIASLVAIVSLPWGFKLIAGPFMDRFSYLPMGFRRPWVLAAQGGLTLSMIAMTAVGDVNAQFWLMVWIGFAINSFAALQDVAVDGMAIDILPENERGRANAFMAFGQVAGFSIFGALDGWLLVNFGLGTTCLVSAFVVAGIFLFVAIVREREGERLLPWTDGIAAKRLHMPAESFLKIFKDLFKVFFLPMSLVLISAEWIGRMGAGVSVTIFPLIGVQELGYGSEVYSFWMSTVYLVSAFVGLFFGPLIDKYGVNPLPMFGFVLSTLSMVFFGVATGLWDNGAFALTILLVFNIATQILFVGIIAGFMMICWNQVAATQFSIYMSMSNLGRSAGAAVYAAFATDITLVDAVFLVAGFYALACVVLTFFDMDKHRERLRQL